MLSTTSIVVGAWRVPSRALFWIGGVGLGAQSGSGQLGSGRIVSWHSTPTSSPRRPRRPSSPRSTWPRSATTPSSSRSTCCRRWSRRRAASSRPCWRSSASSRVGCSSSGRQRRSTCCRASPARSRSTSRRRSRACSNAAQDEAERLKDDYISTEHFLLALADDQEQGQGRPAPARRGRHPRPGVPGAPGGARRPARHLAEPGDDLPVAGEVRPRPDRAGPRGQARPGDRPRRGDPPRDPGAAPAHQEQPGADRRAGRRQDGHRRGAGPAHRARRRARGLEGQAGRRARPGRAWWPAPSTAASSRSG